MKLFFACLMILVAIGVVYALCRVGYLIGGDVSVLATLLAVAGMCAGCVIGLGVVAFQPQRRGYPYFYLSDIFSWEPWAIRISGLIGMIGAAAWTPFLI